MKFLNKKEQVMDFKLTSYGHYLLSIGEFKPEFYAFYDDNILYDGRYAQISESSNQIHDRIKNNTQYLESQVLFEEVESIAASSDVVDPSSFARFVAGMTPTMERPRRDIFKMDSMIGDAYLLGDTNVAPAWKVITLNGNITSSVAKDVKNSLNIPQLDVELFYTKRARRQELLQKYLNEDMRTAMFTTRKFSDGRVIELVPDDLMVYVEEVNTTLLTENFDIEVYEITSGSTLDTYNRKYFIDNNDRIMGGYLTKDYIEQSSIVDRENNRIDAIALTSSVSHYFNILYDSQLDEAVVCKAAETFNKSSYYIDLDFDCDNPESADKIMVDIYGVVTEPEICQ
tara:strand:- start:2813 stop:3838 length:1026 start_codon:yes stop_codon:yes gene_type:complete